MKKVLQKFLNELLFCTIFFQLEADKKRKAREETESLLARMATDDGGGMFEETVAKRARIEEEEEENTDDRMENIVVHTIQTNNENCTHEVAIPPNSKFRQLEPKNGEPAKYYPFQLDAFQVNKQKSEFLKIV